MIAYAPSTRFDSFKRAILAIDPDACVEQYATPDESGACFDSDKPDYVLHQELSDTCFCFVEVCEEI